jgi:hypothetical protein
MASAVDRREGQGIIAVAVGTIIAIIITAHITNRSTRSMVVQVCMEAAISMAIPMVSISKVREIRYTQANAEMLTRPASTLRTASGVSQQGSRSYTALTACYFPAVWFRAKWPKSSVNEGVNR